MGAGITLSSQSPPPNSKTSFTCICSFIQIILITNVSILWVPFETTVLYPIYKLKALTHFSFNTCIKLMMSPFYESYLLIRCLILNLASQVKTAYSQCYFWKSLSSPWNICLEISFQNSITLQLVGSSCFMPTILVLCSTKHYTWSHVYGNDINSLSVFIGLHFSMDLTL